MYSPLPRPQTQTHLKIEILHPPPQIFRRLKLRKFFESSEKRIMPNSREQSPSLVEHFACVKVLWLLNCIKLNQIIRPNKNVRKSLMILQSIKKYQNSRDRIPLNFFRFLLLCTSYKPGYTLKFRIAVFQFIAEAYSLFHLTRSLHVSSL